MVGYARASMADRTNQRQVNALERFGVSAEKIFSDLASGRSKTRPGWTACLQHLRSGDLLVVQALDRLGANLVEVIDNVKALHDKGVGLRTMDRQIDTRSPDGEAFFQTVAVIAQIDRKLVIERALHGLMQAHERGVVGGRKKTYTDAQIIGAMQAANNNYEKAGTLIGATKITMIRRWKTIQRRASASKPTGA